jgi:hypothetical protein
MKDIVIVNVYPKIDFLNGVIDKKYPLYRLEKL